MKYCVDCCYMDENSAKGKFKCTNSRSGYDMVSARKQACAYWLECFSYKRGMAARERLMKESRDHGFYLVTALTDILGLDDSFLDTFRFFKEEVLTLEENKDFLNEYEDMGPYMSQLMLNDQEVVLFATYLVENYLIPFQEKMNNKEYDVAVSIYKELFNAVQDRYNLNKQENVSKK